MPIINLPYGKSAFNSDKLREYIQSTGRDYIIQGQVACTKVKHPKHSSLDYWLRDYAQNLNTKQAVNEVITALVSTGEFAEGNFICPDSGEMCKGVRIVQ